MTKYRILVVDDEPDILELVRYNLEQDGSMVDTLDSGEKVQSFVQRTQPDLIVLDLMLPGIDGLEVTRRLKNVEKTRHVPIVMLTAKGEDSDIVAGLELGAEDYVTKPFSPKVLVARIRTILRRTEEKKSKRDPKKTIRIHGVTIDPSLFKITFKNKDIELTKTEFDLLYFLATNPDHVFTRDQIIDHVKGEDYPVTDRSVDVQVVGLRKKLGTSGKFIETVHGIGYRFKR